MKGSRAIDGTGLDVTVAKNAGGQVRLNAWALRAEVMLKKSYWPPMNADKR